MSLEYRFPQGAAGRSEFRAGFEEMELDHHFHERVLIHGAARRFAAERHQSSERHHDGAGDSAPSFHCTTEAIPSDDGASAGRKV